MNSLDFQSMIENISDILMVMDDAHIIRYASPSVERVAGFKPEEMIGIDALDFVHPDDLPATLDAFSRLIENPLSVESIIHRLRHKNGLWLTIETIGSVRNTAGKTEVVVSSRDITAQTRAERDLEKIFNLSVDMICIADKNGYFKKINPAFSKTLGYTDKELLSRPFAEFVHPDDREKTLNLVKENILLGKSVKTFVNRYICKDGSIKWFEWTSQPVISEGIDFAIARDITERKKSEEALERSEARFQSFMRNFPGLAYIKDSDGRVVFANEGFSNLLGLNPVDMPNKTNFDLFPSEFAEKITQDDKRIIKSGRSEIVEEFFAGRHWVTYKFPIQQSGIVPLLGGLTIDNTERKKAEDKLQSAVLYTRTLIETSLDPLVTINPEGKIIDVNEATIIATGVSRENIIGTDFADYFTEPEEAKKGYEDVLAKGYVTDYPLTIRHRDGKMTDVLYNASVYKDVAGNVAGVFAAARDITGQKLAENALKELVFKYRIVANNTSNWEFWLDPQERFIYTSPSCKNITGHTVEEFMSDHSLLRNIIHPEDRLSFDNHRHEALYGQKPGTMEFRVILPDGTIRWIDHVCQPVTDKDERFMGTRGSNRDITKKKMMEEELLKVRNLESLGILAGGIAHDFNNLLQGILGNISMAKINTPPNSKAFGFLDSAENLYSVARELTNQFLSFAEGGVSDNETIQTGKFIKDTVTFSLSGSNVKAVFDLPEDLLSIKADAGQLRQVLNNIVFNARDSMPSGGMIQVNAKNELILQGEKNLFIKPGKYVRISIKDHGVGIPKENLSRVFDPYFSTKKRGSTKGMGLGLTIGDAIIRKHGGMIKIESEAGAGTTVHIYLPASVSETENIASKTASEKSAAKTDIRILIMDDEPAVFEVAVDFLEFAGYRVDLCVNGEDAVKAYKAAQEAGDPYAAVILDLTIPGGMGGKEAVAILRQIDPEVKAIVSSGYSNDPVFTDYSSYGFTAGIAKPYRLEALKETIESVLAR